MLFSDFSICGANRLLQPDKGADGIEGEYETLSNRHANPVSFEGYSVRMTTQQQAGMMQSSRLAADPLRDPYA